MDVLNTCYGHFGGGTETIWAGPDVIIGGQMRGVEPRALTRWEVIWGVTGINFGGGGVNALARPRVTFIVVVSCL